MEENVIEENEHKKFKIVLFLFLVVSCLIYLGIETYTSYESFIKGIINPSIAKWSVKINGEEITFNEDGGVVVDLNNINWTCSNIKTGKVGPGCVGTVNIEIDSTGSDTAILYHFNIIDKTVDESKILKINDLTFNGISLVQTSPSEYSGYLTTGDIKTKGKFNVNLEFVWDETVDTVYDEDILNDDSNFIQIEFNAEQYLGETLVQYNG